MAYEKITDLSTDTVVKIGGVDSKTNKPNPVKLEGYYLGAKTVVTPNGNSVIHVFQTSKGNLGAWGTADLNVKLGQVRVGTMTLIEYGGKKKLAGGKTRHSYTVSQDRSNALEVSGNVNDEDNSVDNSSEEAEDFGTVSDDSDADAEAEQQAALILAERAAKAAKVQEILNRGKGAKKA